MKVSHRLIYGIRILSPLRAYARSGQYHTIVESRVRSLAIVVLRKDRNNKI